MFGKITKLVSLISCVFGLTSCSWIHNNPEEVRVIESDAVKAVDEIIQQKLCESPHNVSRPKVTGIK